MGAVWVIVSVMVALLATWGGLSMWRALFAWFFAPPQIRGCVLVTCAKELETLDFLLTEAEKSCECRRGAALLVIITPEVSVLCEQAQANRVAVLGGEMTLEACLDKHGAVLIQAKPLNLEE